MNQSVIFVTLDEATFTFCQRAFSDTGLELYIARNVKEYLTLLREKEVGAVIVDSAEIMETVSAENVIEGIKKLYASIHPRILLVLTDSTMPATGVLDLLHAGATDVLPKPVKPRLMAEHVKAFIRLSERVPKKPLKKINPGNSSLIMDIEGRRCYVVDRRPGRGPGREILRREIKLTRNEYSILVLLAEKRGKLVTFEEFRKNLWPTVLSSEHIRHTLLQHIANIKKKIGNPEVKLENLWGEGYRLS